jgi:serine/threonine protein kinase
MTAILPLEAGAIVGGHYSIEGLINTGGFGSVYRGVALSEGNRLCAIKETYDVTPAARRQALMEAAILFTVKSEHLPQVYDAFEEKGRFYLVMQLIEGQNCAQMVKMHGGPFSEPEVLSWFLPVADILQELHGRNPPVLHRDIKPANIILTPRGQAVLVDFGLTRLYDPNTQTMTMARAVSEGFSPLEQYIGQTSPQSDIYSLAATMYFLLTAQAPPASVARSMQDGLVPPRQINPQISPKLEKVLLRALSVSVDQRQASMQEFARVLREPGFSGYTDQTVSQTRYQNASAPTAMSAPPPPPAPARQRAGQVQIQQHAPVNGRQPAPPARSSQAGRRTAEPVPNWSLAPSGGPQQQSGRSGRAIPPPAGGTFGPTYPPLPLQRRALPRPFQQGCLWGMLQGILSALLLLLSKSDSFFYLGIAEGLLFYLLAGFFTTRHGGAATRALRTGFWAGIISTIFYWIALPIGVVIEALSRVQRLMNNEGLSSSEAFQKALNQAKPGIFANNPATSADQGLHSLLILLAIGLACAMGFAFLGGLIGLRNESRRR